ncbi:MAG TPA: triose-phosphate isomerase [Rhizomicrobium sp.]|jgi:triosephosphate isomerase|nr:triose-phosphate isomerase [Rhizomicrobium sp.]
MRQLIAGNWKMNGSLAELENLRAELGSPNADVLVCPPATMITGAAAIAAGSPIAVGGQDCHAEAAGAFTGDISSEMLRDAGASYVIVGHSERRQYHGETDAIVAAKAKAAWRAGLKAIICVGESEDHRLAGQALSVCGSQVEKSVPAEATPENTAVAYEPIWAIGTGKTATADDIAEMHSHVRSCLVKAFGAAGHGFRILYGGSVKPSNAAEILATKDVGGALVGGASLKANDFIGIICAVTSKS